MILIDGKKEAALLREELKKEVSELKSKYNKVPGLSVILIGDLTPSQIYVRNKEKSANEVGLKSEVIKYPDSVEEKVILEKINELNNDKSVSDIKNINQFGFISFIDNDSMRYSYRCMSASQGPLVKKSFSKSKLNLSAALVAASVAAFFVKEK